MCTVRAIKGSGLSLVCLAILMIISGCGEVDDPEYSDVRGAYIFSIRDGADLYKGTFSIGEQEGGDVTGAGELEKDDVQIGFSLIGEIDGDDNVEMFWSVVDIEIYDCTFHDDGFTGRASSKSYTGARFEAHQQ